VSLARTFAMTSRPCSAARTASSTASISLSQLGEVDAAVFLLSVSAAATAAGDTLDVYIQQSPDGGTTWDDFVHFTQVLGNGGAKKYVASWTRSVTPESEMKAPADAGIAAGVLQGAVGNSWRVKWVIVDADTDDASFTFSVSVDLMRRR